jgi:hypothetical protein
MAKSLLVVSVACAALAAGSSSASATTAPRLRLLGAQPLVVRGESFQSGERVVVTALTLTGPRRLVVRATTRGRFGATFRLPNQPCRKAFAVRAVGRLGSRATLTVPGEACVPPPID